MGTAPTSAGPFAGERTFPNLLNSTIEEVAYGLQSGQLTTVDLTKAYLARIDEASGFNAVLQINPDALSAAQKLDDERKNDASRGPLHVIPILVKDNIATADKFDVSAGSFALLGAKPSIESSLIAKREGLSISSGWSSRGGQTLGASSSLAVAAALGLSTAAIGTEESFHLHCLFTTVTFGSIVEPTDHGLIANDGAIPISGRQDVLDTLTRTTWNIPFEIPDFTIYCKGTDLTDITIGVPRNAFSAESSSPVMVSFGSALNTLSQAGAKQVRGIVRSSEFKRDIFRYLQTLETNPNNIHTAEDIIEFSRRFLSEEFPDRDIGKFLWTQDEGIDVDSDKYREMVAQEQFYGGSGGILGAMGAHNLDLLVVPSSMGIANDLAAKMGFPVLGAPLGFNPEDAPIELNENAPHLARVAPGISYSLTLTTKAFSDGVLIQVGHAFEQVTGVRRNGPLPFKAPSTECCGVGG
ncbi:amidase signature domain-containing protein [Immersiella caudata]|uniref:Amidase signature domain-containing protein n=1 Tax=Immersiella caudata TaxID=314043 RepID=A0AA40BXA9_9PEZI|nr:amidase signature domain-containing protein [Immersiella caudata]